MNPSSQYNNPQQLRDKDGHPVQLSPSWQSLASMSTNQLPSESILESMDPSADAVHESEHDKPSVLPEILPGFMNRMADIHHATLKSVSDSSDPSLHSSSGENNNNGNSRSSNDSDDDDSNSNSISKGRQEKNSETGGSKWTGGTMFPTMMGSYGYHDGSGDISRDRDPDHHFVHQHRSASPTEDANRKLAKNSILYESSDLTESTSQLSDDAFSSDKVEATVPAQPPSRTLVQGGQGGRHWSHELSPEKAGLVGSALEVAGLLKDVILDKIQQHPPTSTASPRPDVHEKARRQMGLTGDEKREAAKAAFGGSEESGDQTVYLEDFDQHLRHENAAKSAAAAAAESAASSSTSAVQAKDLLNSAPDVAQEHRQSVFHLAANPEVKKSLLLDHPEQLGYHARDLNVAPFEDSTTVQHRSAGDNAGQDVSKTGR
ncbi:hypothetical protein BGZ99_005564 [Dissophora globulifera]|uniref:Uncharacterized protein n=1 Tax=Dissophora globulifera TaxID=979702 RepID=A0A9P6RHB2_9FUNG|nr:hypothetical protein BGZ99_005564 [Dissophora globulifera]